MFYTYFPHLHETGFTIICHKKEKYRTRLTMAAPELRLALLKTNSCIRNIVAKNIFSLLTNFIANSLLISALIDNCHYETKESMQYKRLVNLV